MTAAPLAPPFAGEPYERPAQPVLTFTLLGKPQPQGSKSGFIRKGKVIMVEAVKGLMPWRAKVHKVIRESIAATPAPAGYPLLGPIWIDLVFSMHKPLGAPKRKRTWPITKPDADKLARAVLDAGTLAGLWHDDAQVVALHAWKVYPLETPRALRQPGLAAAVYLIDEPRSPAGEQASLL